jgi:hypothetical protein
MGFQLLHGVISKKIELFIDRMFGNRALSRICGPKRDKILGGWRKFLNEELRKLHFSPDMTMIKSSRIS